MKVLVTGGSGFVGSHLCRLLVSEGHDIRVLSLGGSEFSSLDGLPVEKLVGDITDVETVRAAVKGCEWVIHAAANVSYWAPHEAILRRVNVDGTRNVAEACRVEGVKRLLFVSSVLAVGTAAGPERLADEDSPYNFGESRLPYAMSKRLAEKAVATEVERGLDAVIVNPVNIFGPHGGEYHGAEMMRKVRRTRFIPYYSGGFCIVHVEDVAKGILGALERGVTGDRYILGGENLTYRAIVERTAEAMGLRRRFVRVPPIVTGLLTVAQKPWGWLRKSPPKFTHEIHSLVNGWRFYDSTKAKETLGFNPRGFDAILDECQRMGAC